MTTVGAIMEKKALMPMVIVLIFAVATFVRAIPQDELQESTVGKDLCLACHGPFEDIAAATVNFKLPNGAVITPHHRIPFTKEIPECVACHKPHPIPLKSKEEAEKPDNIDWCYTACHHNYLLQRCSECHEQITAETDLE